MPALLIAFGLGVVVGVAVAAVAAAALRHGERAVESELLEGYGLPPAGPPRRLPGEPGE